MSNQTGIGEKLKSYLKHPGSFIVMLLVMLGAIITFAVLLFLIAYILINGVPHIKPSLFAFEYTSENASLMPALINTIIMTLLSLLIAVPFGIFSASMQRKRRLPVGSVSRSKRLLVPMNEAMRGSCPKFC